MVYHKNRWNHVQFHQNFDYNIRVMKAFSAERPDYMYRHIGERFLPTAETQTIKINANISKAKYHFFTENIIDNTINLRYFRNQPVEITPDKIAGYQFKHWEYAEEGDIDVQTLTEPKYTGILTRNISLHAVYEEIDLVTSVAVNPNTVAVLRGRTQQFTAEVTYIGDDYRNSSKNVDDMRWRIGAVYTVVSHPQWNPLHKYESTLKLVSRPQTSIAIDVHVVDHFHQVSESTLFELDAAALDSIVETIQFYKDGLDKEFNNVLDNLTYLEKSS